MSLSPNLLVLGRQQLILSSILHILCTLSAWPDCLDRVRRGDTGVCFLRIREAAGRAFLSRDWASCGILPIRWSKLLGGVRIRALVDRLARRARRSRKGDDDLHVRSGLEPRNEMRMVLWSALYLVPPALTDRVFRPMALTTAEENEDDKEEDPGSHDSAPMTPGVTLFALSPSIQNKHQRMAALMCATA